jgi:hypothetical protein
MTRSRIINVMNGAKLKYDSRFMELYLEDYNGNNRYKWNKKHDELKAKHDGIDLLMKKI